jgi:FixJ family two-component response regulator
MKDGAIDFLTKPLQRAQLLRVVRQALENPREYPPLRQAVVPDDRVVIAFSGEQHSQLLELTNYDDSVAI